MSTPEPRKRAAFEPATRLAEPLHLDPAMKRPTATVVGSILVVLRALSGVILIAATALSWDGLLRELFAEADVSAADTQEFFNDVSGTLLWIVVAFGAVLVLCELAFAVLIFLGFNWPRLLVMIGSVISISTMFASWWAGDMEIHLTGTLLAVAFDVLLLLALSSRAAAAYARRNERR